jgi:hypothetical protein
LAGARRPKKGGKVEGDELKASRADSVCKKIEATVAHLLVTAAWLGEFWRGSLTWASPVRSGTGRRQRGGESCGAGEERGTRVPAGAALRRLYRGGRQVAVTVADGGAPPCRVRRKEGEDGKQDGDDGVSVRSGTGQGELVGPRVGWEEKEKGDPGWACSG